MSEREYDGIAIIGITGRFPGAGNVEEFWGNVVDGRETVSFFSDDELVRSGLDPAELRRGGRYVAARGILKDIDCFDAAFFGVHPREAEVMDPQQRIFLETCWEALERAGYSPNRIRGSVGVFAGSTFNTFYLHALHQNSKLIELVGAEQIMFGNERDYLTTRVAYKLGLKGPALNVATACSTSLVAVSQAVQSLLTYQCDVALAGAVSITVPQARGYYFDDGQIGSADGHTRTFDAQATGTVFSNGVGVVVLKRLDEALADGDQIYAVIRGAAINNDGSERVSFGAPGVDGQAQVIAMAHALSGVDPATITCVEAHGTATPLGDPIEVAALTKAFRLGTDEKQFCALGSVKTNVGHLDVAAGVAGLIKMSLALHHKVIPASLHFTEANPKLGLEQSPFYVNTTLRDWAPPDGVPRRAGVSSFGTGGTNAHVVLEEAPPRPLSGASRPSQLLVLSAKTPEALDRATANLREYLKGLEGRGDASASPELADAAFTLQTGRGEFVRRRIVVCRNAADAAEALEKGDSRRVFTHHQQLLDPPVVFMFPGQGAQYPGMGAELYAQEPVLRAEVDRCADHLRPLLGVDLRDLIFQHVSDADGGSRLQQTRFTQPALFVVEYALARLWMSWGIKPAAMIGHSVGEYVAGCLAGVMSLEDALWLIARRGALVQEQPAGAMLAIRLPVDAVSPFLQGQLAIAAMNAPSLCVVSGPIDEIGALETRLVAQGAGVSHLHTSHAFHSPMMDAVVVPFTTLVRQVPLAEPRIPYVSNVTGRWITAQEATSPEYWSAHIRQTVRFSEGVGELLKNPRHVLLEVGPGQTLCTLARQHPARQADQTVLASLPPRGAQELAGILETLGRLWMTGVHVEWPAFYVDESRRRVVLPTYPFERTRYWPQAERSGARLPAAGGRSTAAAHVDPEPPATPIAAPSPVQDGTQTTSRKDRLVAASRSLLQELSGYDFSSVDASADLLELGLDSLLLTQAAQVFHRKFGISITFRQLMEELSSVAAIASYLDANLPPEVERPLAPTPTVAPTAHPDSAQHALLEQLLRQQQQLTSQLQQLLGERSEAASAPPVVSPRPLKPAAAPVKGHGPFKPLDRGPSAVLSSVQRRALDDLIASYTARTAGSKRLAAEQRKVLADPRSVAGFNRLWKEMVYPLFTVRSDGSKMWDVDGNEYVDFVMGFGASLFGHRPLFVVQAVREQLELGFEIGPIQPLAAEVAGLVRDITGQPRVAFTNTGSEAVLAAMRLARTVTRRDKIAVFANAYHGIFDEVLFRPDTVNGEAAAAPIAPGIPDSALAQMIVLDYCDPKSLDVLRRRGSEIAAVLVEPIQARRLELEPAEFLHELRRVTEHSGSALIIDEIVTGFRLHPAGAQGYFGVRADLATYGKAMGGGVPIGVVAGDPKFMDALDGGQWQYGDASFPEVGVTFFAGTFVRHPLALAAARATLTRIKNLGPDLQQGLADRTAHFANKLRRIVDGHRAPYEIRQFSSLMQLTIAADQKLGGLLFYLLRERGIHVWENRGVVMTTSHDDHDLTRFATALEDSLAIMGRAGLLTSASRSNRVGPAAPEAKTEEPSAPEIVPFTEAQLEVWLASQMSTAASCAFNEAIALELHGPLDAVALERALAQVVARHESLRMIVVNEPLGFRTLPDTRVPLSQQDLTAIPVEKRERAIEEALRGGDASAFDLARGPLLRATLLKLASDRHLLTMAAHHIVCDGWSFGIILRDLATFYTSAVGRSSTSLPPAPLQASRFAREAVARQDGEAAGRAESFWISQFASIPDPLELPADRPRPTVKTYRGHSVTRGLDSELIARGRRLATQQHTTLFTTVLAAFEALVCRLSGQSDFVIGVPIAGQSILDGQDLVAHCVNFVPLRCTVNVTSTFEEHLGVVRRRWLDASEHQDFTYGRLLKKLRLGRGSGRDPLISISLTLDPEMTGLNFQNLDVHPVPTVRSTSKRDLHLNVKPAQSGWIVEAEYDSDIFDRATVERWLESYQFLLAAAVARPDSPISELPLSSDEDARRIFEWNNTARDYPLDQSLASVFEAQVRLTPDAMAATCDGQHLSYGELNRRANQLARFLTSAGVGPGILAGVALERSFDLLIAFLAVAKAGGAYVPLDLSYPKDRLAWMVTDSAVPLIITRREFAGALPAARLVCVDDEGVAMSLLDDTDLPPQAGPDDLAYVMYTSGSTGRPKGVAVPHRGVVRLVRGTDYVCWSDVHAILQMAPASFDASTFEIWGALLNGARSVLIPDRLVSFEKLANILRSECVDCVWLTAALFNSLIDAKPGMLAGVRQLVVGGEALSVAHVQRALTHLPHTRLVNGYGPTESTTFACTYEIPRVLHPETESIPIGRPIANTQAYVLDRSGSPVSIGVAGELYLGGDGLAREYLGQPALTAERFVPNPFDNRPGARLYRTGDLARWRPDGNLEFLGRVDRQVKLRGFRIEPAEVEHALRASDAIRDVVVEIRKDVEVPHLTAYVVRSEGNGADESDLRDYLKCRLPDYMVPSEFVFLSALPLSANGKIDRAALPSQGEILPNGSRNGAFANEVETELGQIWSEVLGVPSLTATDNFFELGGHSLLAITLFSRIHDWFGLSLPIGTLFERPTIRDLAPLLPAIVTREPNSTLHLLSAGGNKPPIILMHGVDGSLWGWMRVAKHLGDERPVYGLQTTLANSDVTVVGIAAQCVAELLEKVPVGPYHLVGFCTGAKTAIEVANQLQAKRQQVGLIAVLDYGTVDEPLPRSIAGAVIDFLRNLPLWITYDFIPVGPARVAGRLRSRVRVARLAIEKRLGWRPSDAKPDIRDELGIWRYPADQVGSLTTIWNAFENYTIRPYAGRISLFRPRAEPLLPKRWPKDLGWGTIATGGVDVINVPGSHETMLDERFLPAVAARLVKALEQAEAAGRPHDVPVSSNIPTALPRTSSLTDLAPEPAPDTAAPARVF